MIVDSSATTGSPAASAARTSSRTTSNSSICIYPPVILTYGERPQRSTEEGREKDANASLAPLCILCSLCSLRLCGSPRFHLSASTTRGPEGALHRPARPRQRAGHLPMPRSPHRCAAHSARERPQRARHPRRLNPPHVPARRLQSARHRTRRGYRVPRASPPQRVPPPASQLLRHRLFRPGRLPALPPSSRKETWAAVSASSVAKRVGP